MLVYKLDFGFAHFVLDIDICVFCCRSSARQLGEMALSSFLIMILWDMIRPSTLLNVGFVTTRHSNYIDSPFQLLFTVAKPNHLSFI